MKFDALRSSVARLFETAATLVAPKSGAMEDPYAPITLRFGGEAELREANPEIPPNPSIDRIIHDALVNSGTLPPGAKVAVEKISGNPSSEDVIKRWKGAEVLSIPHRLLPGIEHPGADQIPDKLMEDIEDMVRKAIPGADVMVRRVDAQGLPPNPALKDIFDTAIKPPPDDNFQWETWAKIRDESPIPHGWAYCRIANRYNMASRGLPDTCKFTFGIVRGTFGLWSNPYNVCSFDLSGPVIGKEQAKRVLFSVCHLPSGTNMGLFFDVNLAAEACELMDKTHTDWSHIDHNDPRAWGGFFNQMVTLWAHVGIQQSISHAHNLNGDGPAMVIFERTPETMAMFRPLVLS